MKRKNTTSSTGQVKKTTIESQKGEGEKGIGMGCQKFTSGKISEQKGMNTVATAR